MARKRISTNTMGSNETTYHTPRSIKRSKITTPEDRSAALRRESLPTKKSLTQHSSSKHREKARQEATDTASDEDAEEEVSEEESDEVEADSHSKTEVDDEEPEISAPVVFQCGTCRSIFGDSYAFVSSNAELLLVTLSAITNITIGKEPYTSKEGLDMGSSYHELVCKQCQTVLGRQYVTTPIALDPIRSLYSFSTSSIASYQLGYPQLTLREGTMDGEAMEQATLRCHKAMEGWSHDRQELRKLQTDMIKVQNLLLVVDERLHALETQDEDSEEEE